MAPVLRNLECEGEAAENFWAGMEGRMDVMEERLKGLSPEVFLSVNQRQDQTAWIAKRKNGHK